MNRIYDRLPYYAQIADRQGILALLCDRAIQPELDRFEKLIRQIENELDTEGLEENRSWDFLGQFFGLKPQQSHWLGVGLNPQWSGEYKRSVIQEISAYWRAKGTSEGIIKAIQLWLQWEAPAVEFIHPHASTREQLDSGRLVPQNWFTYGDRYPSETTPFIRQKRLGSGDYLPGKTYKPQWKTIEEEILQLTNGKEFSTSKLGSNNSWLNLYPPTHEEWQQVSHHISELSPEIWDGRITPSNICWLRLSSEASFGEDIWLIVATANYTYALRPYYNGENLEFIFRPRQSSETITSLELVSDRIKIFDYLPPEELLLHPDIVYGVIIEKSAYISYQYPDSETITLYSTGGELSYTISEEPGQCEIEYTINITFRTYEVETSEIFQEVTQTLATNIMGPIEIVDVYWINNGTQLQVEIESEDGNQTSTYDSVQISPSTKIIQDSWEFEFIPLSGETDNCGLKTLVIVETFKDGQVSTLVDILESTIPTIISSS